MALDFDMEKERELDDLHTQLRKLEQEKEQLQRKIEHIDLQESRIKIRINEMNDDDYVSRKLQLLYDQKHEKKGR